MGKAARSTLGVLAAKEPEDRDDHRMVVAGREADAWMLDIDLLSSPDVHEAAWNLADDLRMLAVDPRSAFPTEANLLTAIYMASSGRSAPS